MGNVWQWREYQLPRTPFADESRRLTPEQVEKIGTSERGELGRLIVEQLSRVADALEKIERHR